jgi:hypothetical protein
MVELDSPSIASPNPAFEREARHAGDRGKGFSPKSEARHLVDGIFDKLGGCVPLERQAQFRRGHPATIVGHFDELEAAGGKPDRYVIRASIERILDQFLKGARGPFHHFASSNAIDELGR